MFYGSWKLVQIKLIITVLCLYLIFMEWNLMINQHLIMFTAYQMRFCFDKLQQTHSPYSYYQL